MLKVHLAYKPGKSKKHLTSIKRLDKLIFNTDDPCEDYEGTYWFLIYDGKKPIAFAGIKIQSGNIGYMNRCGVKDKYRGFGLQKILIKARILLAKELGLQSIRTYTSLDNYASVNSLIKNGFRLVEPIGDLDTGKWLVWEKKLSRSKSMMKPLGPISQWSGATHHNT